MELSQRSLNKLQGVHPDLVRVIKSAATDSKMDFVVTEGVRSLTRQKELCAAGASKTLKSKHLSGKAVDLAVLVGGKVRWDWPLYEALSKIIKAAAVKEGLNIVWGGDWKDFKDGPHYQLR